MAIKSLAALKTTRNFTNVLDTCISNSYQATVENTTAFVRNADSIVNWTQPAMSYIKAIRLFFPSATYSTGTGNNLGFEVGHTSSGAEIVATVADEIIDAGADGTDIAQYAMIQLTVIDSASSGTTLAAAANYTTAERTVYLNTTCDNTAAVTTAGTVRWIIEYGFVSDDRTTV